MDIPESYFYCLLFSLALYETTHLFDMKFSNFFFILYNKYNKYNKYNFFFFTMEFGNGPRVECRSNRVRYTVCRRTDLERFWIPKWCTLYAI